MGLAPITLRSSGSRGGPRTEGQGRERICPQIARKFKSLFRSNDYASDIGGLPRAEIKGLGEFGPAAGSEGMELGSG